MPSASCSKKPVLLTPSPVVPPGLAYPLTKRKSEMVSMVPPPPPPPLGVSKVVFKGLLVCVVSIVLVLVACVRVVVKSIVVVC